MVESGGPSGGAGPKRSLSGEVGGEQAERLAVVGGQGGAVTLKGAGDTAAGGTRAVTEGLDAALPLQFCRKHTERKTTYVRGILALNSNSFQLHSY